MPNMGSIMPKSGMTKKTLAKEPVARRASHSAQEASAQYAVRRASPAPNAALSAADALFTTTQQRVLGLLFGDPDRSFFANELIGLTGSGSGAVQRELARLEASGLVRTEWVGNRKHFQANKESPIFYGLWDIIQKTVGLAGPLKNALHPLAGDIRAAFVFGSVAKRQESAGSDIDLFVVSDTVGYAELFGVLESASVQLGRPINPTVLTVVEFQQRIADGRSFVKRVMAQPKIWLIGSDGELGV